MLRRKLLLTLLSLAGLLLLLAVAALVSLQGVFSRLDHINAHAHDIVDGCNEFNALLATTEVELGELKAGRKRRMNDLLGLLTQLQALAQRIDASYVARQPETDALRQEMARQFALFDRHVQALAGVEDPLLAQDHNLQALEAAARLRGHVLQITRAAHRHGQEEQRDLTRRFRWLVVGLALGFVLVINLSILLLMRTAGMVLRPVEKLVDASRELARERFDHRVSVGQKDEFDELGRAFNRLAEQLQQNEQRKIDTLRQTGLTLNHELNNAVAIIELQLAMLKRQANNPEALEKCLRQIHENLRRMSGVVQDLKNIRRIVLTDYTQGVKMLDLERSVREEPGAPEPGGDAPRYDQPMTPR